MMKRPQMASKYPNLLKHLEGKKQVDKEVEDRVDTEMRLFIADETGIFEWESVTFSPDDFGSWKVDSIT